MKRFRRWVLNGLTALLLVVSVVTMALWVRSYFTPEYWAFIFSTHASRGSGWLVHWNGITSIRGELGFDLSSTLEVVPRLALYHSSSFGNLNSGRIPHISIVLIAAWMPLKRGLSFACTGTGTTSDKVRTLYRLRLRPPRHARPMPRVRNGSGKIMNIRRDPLPRFDPPRPHP